MIPFISAIACGLLTVIIGLTIVFYESKLELNMCADDAANLIIATVVTSGLGFVIWFWQFWFAVTAFALMIGIPYGLAYTLHKTNSRVQIRITKRDDA